MTFGLFLKNMNVTKTTIFLVNLYADAQFSRKSSIIYPLRGYFKNFFIIIFAGITSQWIHHSININISF